jgi:hypothetical protein
MTSTPANQCAAVIRSPAVGTRSLSYRPLASMFYSLICMLVAGSSSSAQNITAFDNLNGVTQFGTSYLGVNLHNRPWVPFVDYHSMAIAFTMPEGTFRIDSIDVPMFKVSGADGLTLHLYSDAAGLPGSSLYSFSMQGNWPAYYNVPRLATSLTPSSQLDLSGGSRYWVVAELLTGGQEAEYGWSFATFNRTTDSAWDNNYNGTTPTGVWQLTGSTPDPGLAVYVFPVPESSSGSLLGLALVGTAVFIMKFGRTRLRMTSY